MLLRATTKEAYCPPITEGATMNYKGIFAAVLFTTASANLSAGAVEFAPTSAAPSLMLTARAVVPAVAAGATSGTADTANRISDDYSVRIGDVTPDSIRKAVATAKELFKKNPRQIIVIDIPRGTYDLSSAPGSPINVSDVKPGTGGWLIFRGVGPSQTTLTFSKTAVWIFGNDSHRVAFQGIRMVSDKPTVSQGHVVSCGKGKLVLDIQDGFATPGEIFCPGVDRNWMKQYTDSRTDPHMIQDAVVPVNQQVRWATTTQLAGGRWQMNLTNPNQVPSYKIGALIGIKAKQTGHTYLFFGSSDITFDNVEWRGKSRGMFSRGTSKITFSNCKVRRGEPINGQTPCLSTPDGGPQIGQPNDVAPTTGIRVENCYFEATGDDSIALFKGTGTIRNNVVKDSFCRGILLYQSPGASLENNTVIRCPIMNML